MKSRKVRLAGKTPSGKPLISHRKGARGKPDPRGRKGPKAERRDERKDDKREAKRDAPKGMNARLAAMVAASAELEDVPEPVKGKAPPAGGVDWADLDDGPPPGPEPRSPPPAAKAEPPRKGTVIQVDDEDAPVMAPVKAKPAEVGDGLEVVTKSASKFSSADLEVLRAAIKVKGSGTVVEGINLDELKYDGEGLVPIVAQDRRTGAVLQLGWGSKETIESSLRSKKMSYWSREHGKVLEKGEGSGHPQRLVTLMVDCDKDSLLALVDQDGPACHLDKGTCWHDGRTPPVASFLGELDRDVAQELKQPKEGSETAKLMAEPLGALKAFVQDANNVTRALQGKAGAKPVEVEAADTLYHLIVACRVKGVSLEKVVTELFARRIAEDLGKQ